MNKFNSVQKERNEKHKEFFLNPRNNKAKNEFNKINEKFKEMIKKKEQMRKNICIMLVIVQRKRDKQRLKN